MIFSIYSMYTSFWCLFYIIGYCTCICFPFFFLVTVAWIFTCIYNHMYIWLSTLKNCSCVFNFAKESPPPQEFDNTCTRWVVLMRTVHTHVHRDEALISSVFILYHCFIYNLWRDTAILIISWAFLVELWKYLKYNSFTSL